MSGRKLTGLCVALLLALVVPMPAVEGRSAPDDSYTVTKSDDSGGGTLRDAINWAQGHTGPDEIWFSISLDDPGCVADVCTIQLASPLPTLTNVVGLIIDGYTQPGAEPPDGSNPAELKIVIDGNGNNCFVITGAQHLIRGLVIQDCYHGVEITGSNATDNVIAGNHIGTDVYGSSAAGNRHGVYIRSGAHDNTVGGDEPAERNVISGNTFYGVWIEGSSYTNTVSANYIGTRASGISALPNNYSGVHITSSSQNTIGGDASGEGNVISGNAHYGVRIRGSNTGNNVVSGNVIGGDYEAATAVPNTLGGVYIAEGAGYNRIGGSTAAEQNVIVGNDGDGVWIEGAHDNVVAGNLIGLNAWDWAGLGNVDGVQIDGGAQDNAIGGDTAAERNVISGNAECGVRLEGEGTTGNVVSGNYIGTDTAGVRGIDDLGNGQDGVLIVNGAAENVVGGDTGRRAECHRRQYVERRVDVWHRHDEQHRGGQLYRGRRRRRRRWATARSGCISPRPLAAT